MVALSRLHALLFLTASAFAVSGCDESIMLEILADQDLDHSKIPEITQCLGLTESRCNATPGCEVTVGQELDFDRQCKTQRRLAACTSMNCGDGALSIAQDWYGARWLFPTTCYPDGWMPLRSSAQGKALSWRECPADASN